MYREGVVEIGRAFRVNGEDMGCCILLDLVRAGFPDLVHVIRDGFGRQRGFGGFVEIRDAFVERPAVDLVLVEGVETVDGSEIFRENAMGMFAGPLVEFEDDVAILDVFGEPGFLVERNEENREKPVVGNTLVEQTVFGVSSVGLAIFE